MPCVRERLRAAVEGLPSGSFVNLPVDAVVEWIEHDEQESATGSPTAEAERIPDDLVGLTVKQVAALMEKGPSTIRGWCPDIPGADKPTGREWRIPRDGLRAYLDGQRMPAQESTPAMNMDPDDADDVDTGAWRNH